MVEPCKKNKSANFAPENKSLARRSLPKGSRDLIPPPQGRRPGVGFLYLIPTFCMRMGRPVRATRGARVLIPPPPIGCRALKCSGACPLPPKKVFGNSRKDVCCRPPVPGSAISQFRTSPPPHSAIYFEILRRNEHRVPCSLSGVLRTTGARCVHFRL